VCMRVYSDPDLGLKRVVRKKNENGDLLADFHNILKTWKNYFSLLLNVHRASDVRQI
jgi:hypothetical protein